MPRKTRKYTTEFKQEAVDLALSSSSVSDVAEQLGIPKGTLYTWIDSCKKVGIQSVENTNGKTSNVDVSKLIAENRELHKKLSRLEQEKAILKKAATYFAKELG